MTILVYSTDTCPKCVLVKKFLKEQNIEFTEVNLMKERDRVPEMMAKTGRTSIPVIDVNGIIIDGFHKEQILEAIKNV